MKVDLNVHFVMRICFVFLTVLLGWYFSDLLLYLFLAFIFSLIGKSIARKISAVKVYKFGISYGIATALTMCLYIFCIASVLLFFIPMLIREAQIIANVNYDDLSTNLSVLFDNIQRLLYSNGLIAPNETLTGFVTNEIKDFVNLTAFSNILGGVLSATGSFFFGLFTVLFLTFFFIKDDFSLEGVALILFGKRYVARMADVSNKINRLLSRYFIGLLIEIISMMLLLYTGLALFGIKGALLFAVFGGLLNAVPYLGPVIGAATCCLFGLVNCVSISEYQDILPSLLKIAGVFVGANLLDNIVLQPLIYSQSVKIHPAEIFLVIIMGGSLAGIVGMLIAIPVYTIIRTIAVELFNFMNAKSTR